LAINRKLFNDTTATSPGVVIVAGRVVIGSTGAVGTQTGLGFTVARSGVGLYTITVSPADSGVPAILYSQIDVVFATANNTQTVKQLTQVASTGVVTVQCNDAGTVDTAAELPSGSILQVLLLIKNVGYTI
jgi:hypothetical protein